MSVLVRHGGLVAVAVVRKGRGIVRRVGRIQVSDRDQLVRGVIGILDNIPGLVRGGDHIARPVIGGRGESRIREDCFDQALSGIKLRLRGIAVGIGHGNLIACVVIGVLRASGCVGDGNEIPK